jgi:hypothetical protein
MPLALVMSFFWGARMIYESYLDLSGKNTSKLSYFFWFFYQFTFNFVGSFAGWACFYALLIRVGNNLSDFSSLGFIDFILFILSLLGLTGHLPQTIYGLVVSIGKFAEAGTSKILPK